MAAVAIAEDLMPGASARAMHSTTLMNTNQPLREFTLRGVLLGALITLAFTAANVYLGLKVGLTFASAIPAAVISMALLYRFKDSNILENNMVQTQASAAGTLSSVIFVLPGLLMLGLWSGFPFWQTALICAAGGTLGVLYTVPLRRVMVVQSPTCLIPKGWPLPKCCVWAMHSVTTKPVPARAMACASWAGARGWPPCLRCSAMGSVCWQIPSTSGCLLARWLFALLQVFRPRCWLRAI